MTGSAILNEYNHQICSVKKNGIIQDTYLHHAQSIFSKHLLLIRVENTIEPKRDRAKLLEW